MRTPGAAVRESLDFARRLKDFFDTGFKGTHAVALKSPVDLSSYQVTWRYLYKNVMADEGRRLVYFS